MNVFFVTENNLTRNAIFLLRLINHCFCECNGRFLSE
ncbi:Uncharacterised protein [Klebsiella grimontii]|nr:Uncharacterised protein [Klebsiella grimontii]VTS37538.1 Uncharacterised protein [Klebsiella grimontii]